MNLQTFKAPTMALALHQVKSAMGHDAIILHTRTYHHRQWLGLKRKEVVEITAGRGTGQARRSKPASSASFGPGFSKSAMLPSAQPTIRTPVENSRQLLQTPAVGNAMMLGITQEMNQLKNLVQAMATYSTGHPSFNPTTVTQLPSDAALQAVFAPAWHH